MKRNLQNDKLVMKIIRKQTCKMITQDYDKSVSKKQESGLKWLIIFLGKVCSPKHWSSWDTISIKHYFNLRAKRTRENFDIIQLLK